MAEKWRLEWDYGVLDVHARGGMLGSVALNIGDDHTVKPFYEAPWIGDGHVVKPKLLEHLRSEFPCVPFGGTYPVTSVVDAWTNALSHEPSKADGKLDRTDELLHGHCAMADWTMIEKSLRHITISVEYPKTSVISRLVRTVSCDPASPAINFSLRIESRVKSRRPVGLHPNLALPSVAGAFKIIPGDFRFGAIHPAGPEAGVSRAVSGGFFTDLKAVPLVAGGTALFDRLPFLYNTEEIVQLCGADGTVGLIDETAQAAYTLTWDASILPSLQLWISNRGRAGAPWNSRNLCVGVEPLVGVFDLGTRAALANNPVNAKGVATALDLDPENPITIKYRFEARQL